MDRGLLWRGPSFFEAWGKTPWAVVGEIKSNIEQDNDRDKWCFMISVDSITSCTILKLGFLGLQDS